MKCPGTHRPRSRNPTTRLWSGGDPAGSPGLLHAPLREPFRIVYDHRYLQVLFVGRVAVRVEAVLAESLPVVSDHNENRILVEPEILVLLKEALQEDVLEAEGVEVTVEILILCETFLLVTVRHQVWIVGNRRQVGGQERLA